MKKIVVLGSGGSGKSTFSKRLGELTGIPVIHLDSLYWRPNWTKPAEDEWLDIVKRECERESWIMDGNFGGTRAMRMASADTIILLDLPRWLCLYRILKRVVLNRGRRRPDMAEGCNEKMDMEFLLWVWNYRKGSRSRALAEIAKLGDKKLIVLTGRVAVERFLNEVEQGGNV